MKYITIKRTFCPAQEVPKNNPKRLRVC